MILKEEYPIYAIPLIKKRVMDLNLVFEEFVECLDRASKKVYTNNDVNLLLASNSSS